MIFPISLQCNTWECRLQWQMPQSTSARLLPSFLIAEEGMGQFEN
jgi:hypothetical protein